MSLHIPAIKRAVVRNMRVHVLPTDRFKTYAVTVHIGRKLRENQVTKTALIPFVLRRGNARYPETQTFREQLEDLYGAGFGFDVVKRGDYQIVRFRMDMIREKFVSDSRSLLEETLRFLGDTITRPLLEDGTFRPAYVEAEKNNLQKRIEAVINDKIRYASQRCVEEMCAGEAYRLQPLGQIEDIQSITPEGLTEAYQAWLAESAIDIYVAGNTTLEQVVPLVSDGFDCAGEEPQSYVPQEAHTMIPEVRTVVEKLDVTQGKLNFGLRSPVMYQDSGYPAALVYNGILGGYPHSKLFVNVREKESLAYYAASRYEGHKGILTIQSGIEIDDYEKAKNIILQQLDLLRAGEISDLELEQTKAMLANQLREMLDSAYEMTAFDFNRVLSGAERSVPQLIEEIKATTRFDVQSIAERTHLDTVYFLKNREGGE